MTHEELKSAALSNPKIRAEYEASAPEFELLRTILAARHRCGLNHFQVAERMGIRPEKVERLELSLTKGKRLPALSDLRRYAEAIGCHLEIRFVHN